MSGTAGIINHNSRYNEEEIIKAMCGAMYHRGPGGQTFFSAPGTVLGERTQGERNAFALPLVLDGTIYNLDNLRRELEKTGESASNLSDRELLFALYKKEGESFISRLEGMFALALWDEEKKTLLLARDRMGKKPLYYFFNGENLVFASTISALKCHPAFPARLDPEALADYFSLLYVPQPFTVYRDVYALPAATVLKFHVATGERKVYSYWKLDFTNKVKGSREELAEELRRLVTEAVKKRLDTKAETGVFLSGGIDSNIVSALAAKLMAPRSCRAYTVGFAQNRYDERALARLGAAAINRQSNGNLLHREREVVLPDFSLLEELIARCGQPYADTSLLPTAMLSSFAREEISVALSGDGADELFGGYERYIAMALGAKLEKIPLGLRKLALKGCSLFPDRGERRFSGRLKRFLRISCVPQEERYFAIIDRCPETLRQSLFTPEFRKALHETTCRRFNRAAGSFTARGGEVFSETDIRTYLAGDTLPKADMGAMSCALEVRSPFLDREVAEFAAALPWEMKLNGKERKSILKYAFRDLLIPEIYHAPKKGFGVPVADLLRGKWHNAAEELLFEGPLRQGEFLQNETLCRLWHEHTSGKADHSYILMNVLIFGLFCRQQ